MKELAKYSGAFVMLIGVLVLAIPFFRGTTTNTSLVIGIIIVIEGFLGYLYVNNMKKGKILNEIMWAILLLIIPYFIFRYSKKIAFTEEELSLYNE